MHKHVFGQLRARVGNEGVQLSFYFTTPVFEALRNDRPASTIRIHRKCESRFRWGRDYAEYFDGVDVGKARLLFEGSIEPINQRKFEFLDTTVAIGRTYAYWVSSPSGRFPTGPVAIRVRDPRIWWPQREVEARLAAMSREYPSLVEVQAFGTSVGGHVLRGLRAGNRNRCIALVGTIHAGESGPELMIPAVERLLVEHRALLERVGVAILPNVNIDERERLIHSCPWYLRTNGRGVDLNRNFDAAWDRVAYGYGLVSSDPDAATYRGPGPESEPETRGVVAFLNTVRPAAVLSYHALASITGADFLAPQDAKGDRDYLHACTALVEPFVHAFYPQERWRAGIRFGSSTGSLPAYAYHQLGIPGFDLEWDGNPDAKPSHSDQTTSQMLTTYQERHYRGLVAMLGACCAMGQSANRPALEPH